jgi:hypothetical protein
VSTLAVDQPKSRSLVLGLASHRLADAARYLLARE